MSILVLLGPKGPSAWDFETSKGKRTATCLNDGTIVTVADESRAAIIAAMQQLAARTVAISGAPTLAVPIPW